MTLPVLRRIAAAASADTPRGYFISTLLGSAVAGAMGWILAVVQGGDPMQAFRSEFFLGGLVTGAIVGWLGRVVFFRPVRLGLSSRPQGLRSPGEDDAPTHDGLS